jgi:hypothetical protein
MIIALAAALLLVMLPRVHFLPNLPLEIDEVWTVWQTFGTPGQIVGWTPYDWPPLYYLAVGLWKALVGIHPLAVRMLSVFAAVLGGAFLYRAARRVAGSETAGLFAVLVYGAMQYLVTISTLIRGYIFLLALAPLALWLTVRYFDHRAWAWRRALPLALTLVVMWYSHLTAILIFSVLGVYSLLVYPRKVWRWAWVALFAVPLALPEVLNKLQVTLVRVGVTQGLTLPPFFEAIARFFETYTEPASLAWLLVLGVGVGLAALWLARERGTARLSLRKGAALALWALMPVAMYFLNPLLGFFLDRHLSWAVVGLAILVGWGLARAPRPLSLAVAGALLALTLTPPDIGPKIYSPTFDASFAWLRTHYQPGDVIYIDPDFKNVEPEEWDYFTQVYFPGGLHFVDDPGAYRRVWYVAVDGGQNVVAHTRLMKTRVPGIFVGPWNFLIRLYQAPPDVAGVLYENGLRFHGAEIVNGASPSYAVYREGETVRLWLWWSVDAPVGLDYSISTQVPRPDGAGLLAQFDGPPQLLDDSPRETSRWTPGRFYIEGRVLTLPDPLRTGLYRVNMAVYQWWDNTRMGAPGLDADNLRAISHFRVKSW